MKKFNVTVNGTVYEVEVNEVGGAAKAQGRAPQARPAGQPLMPQPSGKRFPRKQTPDTETVVPRDRSDSRSY